MGEGGLLNPNPYFDGAAEHTIKSDVVENYSKLFHKKGLKLT